MAPLILLEITDAIFSQPVQFKYFFSDFKQGFPGIGQHQPFPVTVQQLNVVKLLQPLQPFGDRRLGNVQFFPGDAEISVLDSQVKYF